MQHIVFFSRGKGRGHAIPDSAIARELLRLEPGVKITFVSYSMGAATLTTLGWNPIDLHLPENNPLWDTVVQAVRVLGELAPTLVVSHEEFAAMPISKALGLPTVFLTDWFLGAETVQMQSLKYADEVIFLDEPGYQDVPQYLAGKIVYVGPVLRAFPREGLEREECRAFLGLPKESTVIVVVPGGAVAHSEALAPILDVVLSAYDALDARDKRLVWVAGGTDHDHIAKRTAGRADVRVMEPHDAIARTMMAASLVITKGNRISVLECEALGIPSISISSGNNPLDDNRVSRIRTNTALRARGLDGELLGQHMTKAMAMTHDTVGIPTDVIATRCLAAARRLQHRLPRSSSSDREILLVRH